jgi:hypothetical protein
MCIWMGIGDVLEGLGCLENAGPEDFVRASESLPPAGRSVAPRLVTKLLLLKGFQAVTKVFR